MRELEYPFDSEYILKKSKRIKKQLLELSVKRIPKKIAVLGGSTTHDIIRIMEIFLLNLGIEPIFYESEYAQYWQDAMFDNEELKQFAPDLIYIHTSNRNITNFPEIGMTENVVDQILEDQYNHFEVMWDKLAQNYHCPLIQNNFEYPFYRLLGNQDGVDIHGRTRFINELNRRFAEAARNRENFYINDINYLSSCFGLEKWSDPFFWHMYKYALCMSAIPELAFNISNIIKAIYGKNKKAFVLDLDNTLWGGIVGDDGPENIEIGQETSMGQVFAEFQNYIKAHKDIGIMLNVASKNEEENALAGLNRPDGILHPDDFILIKANWEPKSLNFSKIADELNVLPESMVFIDDNPAEREIVRSEFPMAAVPEVTTPEHYIQMIDRSGFFEVVKLSDDDKKRNEMYKANVERAKALTTYTDYKDYLLSLEMKGTIKAFEPIFMARIAQLTNKSNQFNLTTKRYSQAEIEAVANDESYITLYGKLEDKFGDNGVVSIVIGKKEEKCLHVDLWLMSCRVLKRDMEFAMMDELVAQCKRAGIEKIYGYYYKTAKNAMVKEFFKLQGFDKISENNEDDTVWEYCIPDEYEIKNHVIKVNE